MSGASSDQEKITVGLDVSDKHVHACFLDSQGNIVEESRLAASGCAAPAVRRGRAVSGCHRGWSSFPLDESSSA